MTQDFMPPHEYHDRVVNYAGDAQGVPVQAQVIAPPAPVCNNLISPHTCA
jgi:hypothetical protein